MGWGSGGAWGGSKNKRGGGWDRERLHPGTKEDPWGEREPRNSDNDGMGPYGRPAEPENGFPLPEQPLWHGEAWQPEGVTYDPASGQFSDGYVPGPGDKPQF